MPAASAASERWPDRARMIGWVQVSVAFGSKMLHSREIIDGQARGASGTGCPTRCAPEITCNHQAKEEADGGWSRPGGRRSAGAVAGGNHPPAQTGAEEQPAA